MRIGAGRSGVVYRDTHPRGDAVARKVFGASGLTKLVQYVLLGAPNPYMWNEDAVACAALRRRILEPLVRHWFGDRLRVAATSGFGWNAEQSAFELYTEFIAGRPPSLHHPMNRGGSEVRDLVGLMRRLLGHLDEAGFLGLTWQAGRGNPVALQNFLLERDGERLTWSWIDLESGVPALFPLDMRELVRFYLPVSWRLRRPLFDDTDTDRLCAWFRTHKRQLELGLDVATVQVLEQDIEKLVKREVAWKALSRTQGGIRYALAKGRITLQAATRYERVPLLWYAVLAAKIPGKAARGTVLLARGAWAWLRALPVRQVLRAVPRFLVSQSFRAQLARRLVTERIAAWHRRGQLLDEEARVLHEHVDKEESAAYITDFGVHLAIKPVVKGIELGVFPLLWAVGLVGDGTLVVLLVVAGAAARTAYTLGRLVQNAWRGHELPWTALFAGMLPIVGNLAFPLQIIASSREEEDVLAQFILYDGFTSLGRRVPIWGGPDTLTEHVFNHVPDAIVRGR